jgi:hypothetical protein
MAPKGRYLKDLKPGRTRWMPDHRKWTARLNAASAMLERAEYEEAAKHLNEIKSKFRESGDQHGFGTVNEASLRFAQRLYAGLATVEYIKTIARGDYPRVSDPERFMSIHEMAERMKDGRGVKPFFRYFKLARDYEHKLNELKQRTK